MMNHKKHMTEIIKLDLKLLCGLSRLCGLSGLCGYSNTYILVKGNVRVRAE